MIATILGLVGEHAGTIGVAGGGLLVWLRLEHRLTRLETIVRLLVEEKREPERRYRHG